MAHTTPEVATLNANLCRLILTTARSSSTGAESDNDDYPFPCVPGKALPADTQQHFASQPCPPYTICLGFAAPQGLGAMLLAPLCW